MWQPAGAADHGTPSAAGSFVAAQPASTTGTAIANETLDATPGTTARGDLPGVQLARWCSPSVDNSDSILNGLRSTRTPGGTSASLPVTTTTSTSLRRGLSRNAPSTSQPFM